MPAQSANSRDHDDPLIHFVDLCLHLSLLVMFLAMFSVVPQIFSKQKQALVLAKQEISTEVKGAMTSPCSGLHGGYGDVDGDGSVTTRDLQFIMQYITGGPTSIPFTADVKARADVNGVNGVDSADARLMRRYLSGTDYTFPMCVDHDGDGFVDGVENYIGTDPYKSCGAGAWPPDIDNDNKVTTQDSLKFIPVLNSVKDSGDGRYNARYDLNHDGSVNTQDVLKLSPYLNTSCKFAPAPTINMQVTPANTVTVGQTITITWTSANTIAPCDAFGTAPGWAGQKPASNTAGIEISSSSPALYDNLKLICYGPGGQKYVTTSVKFEAPPPTPSPSPPPPSPPAPVPVTGNPADTDTIRQYIKDYVGGWNVRRSIGGKDRNFGRFLFGLAGCESRWNDHDYAGPSYHELGLFQYQHAYIPGYGDSTQAPGGTDVWGNTVREARSRGAVVGDDIWNYQHQVQVTAWKVSPNGGGDYPYAWSCYNNGGWEDYQFVSEWPDPNP